MDIQCDKASSPSQNRYQNESQNWIEWNILNQLSMFKPRITAHKEWRIEVVVEFYQKNIAVGRQSELVVISEL